MSGYLLLRASGRMETTASIVVPADRATTIRIATGPDGPTMVGKVKDIEADRWPEVGGTMAWTMGRNFRFVETVEVNELPDRLVVSVANPSGTGRVEHRFEDAEGGTRYTKTVAIPPEGFWHRIAWLWLPGAVKREVRRVAEAATG